MNMEDYDLITEQETDAIFKGNKKGDFILVNGFASKLTGYSENELLNMNISKLFKIKIFFYCIIPSDIFLSAIQF